jgi:hypothetical protein
MGMETRPSQRSSSINDGVGSRGDGLDKRVCRLLDDFNDISNVRRRAAFLLCVGVLWRGRLIMRLLAVIRRHFSARLCQNQKRMETRSVTVEKMYPWGESGAMELEGIKW